MGNVKRLAAFWMAVLLTLSLGSVKAWATDGDTIDGELGTEDSIFGVTAQGNCGDSLKWIVYEDGILYITGSGDMYDYYFETAPWYAYKDTIINLVIDECVTHIGNYAFYNCNGVTTVTLPATLMSIGERAFAGCSDLTGMLTIPEGMIEIGESAFYGTGMTEVSFEGVHVPTSGDPFGEMPNLITIYVPAVAYDDYVTALTPYLGNGVEIVAVGAQEPEALSCTITEGGAVVRGDELGLYMQVLMAAYDGKGRMLGVTDKVTYADGSYKMTIETDGIKEVRFFVLDGQFAPVMDVKIFE